MNTVVAEDLADIDQKIIALSDAYIASGKPYLLSKLGKDLGEDLRKLKLITGNSLADYLKRRMSDRYAVVLAGPHSNIQALVRSDDATVTTLIPSDKKEESSGPRYNYRFWASFAVPLKSGRRFIDMSDFTFDDLEEKPEGNYLEIDSNLIPPENTQSRDNQIRQNIEQWISANGLSQDIFIAQPRSQSVIQNPNNQRSVLEAVIDALDRRQLATTSLSLDIVAALLRRRV